MQEDVVGRKEVKEVKGQEEGSGNSSTYSVGY
jgi:hypothetical protein